MGSITYSFLADSILFHKESLENNFKDIPVNRLEKELMDYRQHCIDNFDELIGEIKGRNSFLKVFSHTEATSINLLKQTALYIDQFIIHDPIFSLTEKQTDATRITTKYLGYNDKQFDKEQLAKAAKFLKDITPMVAADFIKIFPLSYYFERPEGIPFNMPKDYYNDILPRDILDFLRDNSEVKSLKKSGNGGWLVEDELYPCRSIIVDFKNDNLSKSMVYYLFENEIMKFDEQSGLVEFKQTLPSTPPDQPYFEAWINQSLNSASKAYFDKVFIESSLAASLNSTYLCDSKLTNDLLSKNFKTEENIQTYTANQLLNFDLPFIENIDIDKLMTVRELEAETFTNFRIELEKQFRELRTLTDPKQIKLKTENIFHELGEVQGQKIKQKLSHVQKQISLNTLLAIGGLAGSVITSGFSLAATVLAAGKGYKDYIDYREKVKENPAYLLWQVKKK